MSAHTPGPWCISGVSLATSHVVLDARQGTAIAFVWRKEDGPLVAAAPELLKACRMAEHLLSQSYFSHAEGSTLDVIRKVITKAEGKETLVMAHHYLDRAVASDLSYRVFQLRRRKGQLGPCELDSQNRRLYGLPSQMVVREAFVADRESIPDAYQGDVVTMQKLYREG